MSALPVAPAAPSLLDELLAEQASLSAVERFSRHHDSGALPAGARTYGERIPVGRSPGAGQQLAFQVDLDACTGCKACVTACHSLNGLDLGETWRDVGLLVGGGPSGGFQQTVTSACHHCEDPACLAGCPVKAYEKDPVTGIVRHLDDQCIGCQYCVLKCPYDVPKYHADLGIVRKCDMCTGRLAVGEPPACVQGCPNGAITIEIVDLHGEGAVPPLLPGLNGAIPDSGYTRPTTRYRSRRAVPVLLPADGERLEPAPAHDPLAVMLVLMQLSMGALLLGAAAELLGAGALARTATLALAAGSAALGLGAATLHLGRPLYAFRAFLGWRTSWMSREILVLGVYVPLVVGLALTSGAALPGVAGQLPDGAGALAARALPLLWAAALGVGLLAGVCSAMLYVDTRRPAWALRRTGPTFAGTALGLGALAVAASGLSGGLLGDAPAAVAPGLLALGLLVLLVKAVAEGARLREREGEGEALARTRRLLLGPLRARLTARLCLVVVGAALGSAALLAVGLAAPVAGAALAWGALVALALAELVERHLYFTAEAGPAMPGH